MKRPAGLAAENADIPFGLVLLEPVRSADPPIISGSGLCQHVQRLLGRRARRNLLRRRNDLLFEAEHRIGELRGGQVATQAALELGASITWKRREALLPGTARCLRSPPGVVPGFLRVRRNFERRVGPVQQLARAGDFIGPERGAVHLLGAGFGRRAKPDGGPAGNQGWPIGLLSVGKRGGDGVGIMTVDARCGPARSLEAFHLVDGVGKRQWAIDGDAVVIEQNDQLVEPQMTGERDRFVADALHEVAVRGKHVGVVIDEFAAKLGAKMCLRNGHAHRVGEALAKRPGGGLDARRVKVLRMPGRFRAELAEALDLLDGHPLVTEEMQQRIKQHRAMPGGEHEAVAVGPGGVGRVELQIAAEQDGRDIRCSHRQPGMPGICRFDGVHGEGPDRIGHEVMGGTRRWDVVPGRCRLILHEMLHSASVRDRIACAEIVSKRAVDPRRTRLQLKLRPGGQRLGRR